MQARLAKGKRVGPKEGKDGKVTCGSHRTVTGGTNVPSGKIKEPPRVLSLKIVQCCNVLSARGIAFLGILVTFLVLRVHRRVPAQCPWFQATVSGPCCP